MYVQEQLNGDFDITYTMYVQEQLNGDFDITYMGGCMYKNN